ncbi:unnamed protein product [Ambrosiozyma monospora]|uniref:Unnamed protein product n=1 Tax=Ambrosiozyma monospora TaxID=43982 RepID=A0ACB5T7B3_AMBMO|nr:unnamed protein product [Ambrosiozyma monospora]
MFKLLIPKLSIGKLESIFKIVVEKFPQSTAPLLKELVGMNKALSTKFLEPLVETALNRKPKPDYQVVIQAMLKNSEVGNKFTEKIFGVVADFNDKNDTEIETETQCHELLIALFHCYVRSREISEFILAWTDYMHKYKGGNLPNGLFYYDALLNEIGSQSIHLSQVQLTRLIKELDSKYTDTIINKDKHDRFEGDDDDDDDEDYEVVKDGSAYAYGLIAIVSGLLYGCTDGSLGSSLTKTVIANTNHVIEQLHSVICRNKKGGINYRLESTIFMLYGLKDLLNVNRRFHIANHFLLAGHNCPNPSYYFISAFRIWEQDPSLIHPEYLDRFIPYFEKSAPWFQKLVFSRFFVLLNTILNKEQLEKAVQVLLKNNSFENLNYILSNSYLHEQVNLIQIFIGCLLDRITKHNELNMILPLGLIPVFCYKKPQREEALNVLLKASSNSEIATQSRKLIVALLQQPTFKSNIESDPVALFSLFESVNDETETALQSSVEIVKIVLDAHLKQQHDANSSKFIDNHDH